MKNSIKAAGLSLVGFALLISGFVYDLMFAGIPYPDPTPELQVRYDFHSSLAGGFYWTGGILFLCGLLAIPFILRKKKTPDTNTPNHPETRAPKA